MKMLLTQIFAGSRLWLLLASGFVAGMAAGFVLHIIVNNWWLLHHGKRPKDFYSKAAEGHE